MKPNLIDLVNMVGDPPIMLTVNFLYQKLGVDDLMTAHLLDMIRAAYNEEKGVFS